MNVLMNVSWLVLTSQNFFHHYFNISSVAYIGANQHIDVQVILNSQIRQSFLLDTEDSLTHIGKMRPTPQAICYIAEPYSSENVTKFIEMMNRSLKYLLGVIITKEIEDITDLALQRNFYIITPTVQLPDADISSTDSSVNEDDMTSTDSAHLLKYDWNIFKEYIKVSESRDKGLIWSDVSKYLVKLATWSPQKGLDIFVPPIKVKPFLKVATFYTVPFAYPSRENGMAWEGFCVDTIHQLSKVMDFNYQLITAMEPGFKLSNGTWTGLIGQLASGNLDMIVGPLIPTSDMERVMDFPAFYYTSVGFSVVVRRPVTKSPLFKFVKALTGEVWASIIASICLTALLVWFYERVSPSSTANTTSSNAREFTLKESFWFASTSFTQQGGGEAPRPTSARILVSFYWLFAALMLAAFVANLAALETVERLPYPIQSFDQLIKQTRFKYTVINGSNAHRYFVAMKDAEETIYRMWRDRGLNKSLRNEFKEWEYPVKERYKQALFHIQSTGLQPDVQTAYNKVLSEEVALIHDDYDIRYRAARDCRLKEIGQTVASRPYYVALQQASVLRASITLTLIRLLRRSYFENLMKKYTERKEQDEECLSDYVPQSITTASLGGVFVMTLIGVGLGLVVLVLEILLFKTNKSIHQKTDKSRNAKQSRHQIESNQYPPTSYITEADRSFLRSRNVSFLNHPVLMR